MSKELDELEEVAREATRSALEKYIIPDEYRQELVMTILYENDKRIFQLYIPGKDRKDAIVIASANVDKNTKDVDVEISNLKLKSSNESAL